MTVWNLERLGIDYQRANRPVVWILLALFVFVLVARHVAPVIFTGRLADPVITPYDLLGAVPVLFGAAALVVAAGRRWLVTGAVLMATVPALQTLAGYTWLTDGELSLPLLVGPAAATLTIAGLLLVGRGLGGVHSRAGLALVAAGFVISALMAVFAFASARPLLEAAEGIGPALLAGSVVGQFTYLGWAYVLAAALERRATLISVGAGLLLLVSVVSLVVDELVRQQPPGFTLPGVGIAFLLLNLSAWGALIAGLIGEVGRSPEAGPAQ